MTIYQNVIIMLNNKKKLSPSLNFSSYFLGALLTMALRLDSKADSTQPLYC